VTRGLSFSGLIRRTSPFSCLLRHARGCGGPILTRTLTGRVSKRHYHNIVYITGGVFHFVSFSILRWRHLRNISY
jgi:hypothetical protein